MAWIEEADQYPNVKVTYESGDPRFVFYDSDNKQIGPELFVKTYTKDQIHSLLVSKGLERIKKY
jgi:hypothetical protein